MKRLVTIVLISMFVVIAFSGCQEGNSSTSRKMKLVQNENFKLNNTIKAKDAEIASLQGVILERENEIKKLKADSAMAAEKFIEIMKNVQKMNLEVK